MRSISSRLVASLLVTLLPVGPLTAQPAAPVAAPSGRPAPDAQTVPNLDSLPVAFFPSGDPAAGCQGFEARTGSVQVKLTPSEVALRLPASGGTAPIVRVIFDGAASSLTGRDTLRGKVNLLHGDDPAAWKTDLPTFAAVDYQRLFPGVDLRYEGKAGALESTYRLDAGADPAAIRWRYEGVETASIDPRSGDLLLSLAATGQTLRESAPVAWQDIAGERRPVAVRFDLPSATRPVRAGFVVGGYDPSLPLVIDPVIAWSSFLGGSDSDTLAAVATDAAGFVYVTGTFDSSEFPADHELGSQGLTDVLVAKLDPWVAPASQMIHATYVGSSLTDSPTDIAVDSAGRTYVVGTTSSRLILAFPTPGGFQSCADPSLLEENAFFFQLNAAGDDVLYGTCLRGNGDDFANSVAIDTSGRAYIGGQTESTNFPTGGPSGPFQEDQPNADGFVAKIDPAMSGNASLIFSTYLGGAGTDDIQGIAIDPSNRVYVTGVTGSIDFPTTGSAFDTTINGPNDAFVTKLDGVGSSLFYSTFLGGASTEEGRGIAVDTTGSAYVTGITGSDNFPVRPSGHALQPSVGGDFDAFVTKVSPGGNSLIYSTYLGGSGRDEGLDIAIAGGVAHVVGNAMTGFPAVEQLGPCLSGSIFARDAFLTKIGVSGQVLLFASCLGKSGDDRALGVAVGPVGTLTMVGATTSADFPTQTAYQATCGSCATSEADGFITIVGGFPLHRDGFELGTTAEWLKSP